MSIPVANLPQATSFVLYTPSAGGLVPWQYTTFYLSADATITFVDKDGNTSGPLAMSKGYHPILVSKITACDQPVYVMRHSQLS
jgi:hypothetical protein